jgi:uncharacterized protein
VPLISAVPSGRPAIARAVIRGGCPEMLARQDRRRRARWIENYIQMILERDVRDLTMKAQQLDELPRLLAAAGARVAGLLEISELARDTKLGRDTTSRYLTLLELLFLLRRAPAWSRNIGQRLINGPKPSHSATDYGQSPQRPLDDRTENSRYRGDQLKCP